MKDESADGASPTHEGIESDLPESDGQSSFRNHFLIALPTLAGDFFASTVTYLLEHNSKGAFGLVINKPLQLVLCDLFGTDEYEGLQDTRIPVLDGGPVRRDSVFFLHDSGVEYQFTQQISAEISLTTSEDLVVSLAKGQGPARVITAMGYAGWDSGQLERELAENVWLLAPASAEIIFDTPFEQRAQRAAALLGIDLNLVSGSAGHG